MPGHKTILPEVTAGSKPAILVRMYHTCILTFVQSWPYQIQPNSFSSSAAREHAAVAWGSCSSTPIPPWFPEGLGPQRENVRLLMTSKNVSEIYGSSPRKNRQSQEETHLPTIISSGASCLNFRGVWLFCCPKNGLGEQRWYVGQGRTGSQLVTWVSLLRNWVKYEQVHFLKTPLILYGLIMAYLCLYVFLFFRWRVVYFIY